MTKTLESPVKAFPGTVDFPDFLTLKQVRLFENALGDPDEMRQQAKKGKVWTSIGDEKKLPAILACIEKWNIKRIPEHPTLDNFPGTPRGASHELIDWAFDEILKLWVEEIQLPNV